MSTKSTRAWRAAWAGDPQTWKPDRGGWTHVATDADGPRQFAVRLNVAATATSLPRIAAGLLIAVLVTLGGARGRLVDVPTEGGLTLRDDPEHERTRRIAKEEARRTAEEARARADHERSKAEAKAADALTGEMKDEVIRQLGLIYGGLILIGVYMVQPFLVAPSLDTTAKVSVIAFAVAIPLLAALVMINRQEAFRRRRTTSITVNVAHAIAQAAAFVGIVAGFWHITWIAGVTFLAAGFIAVLVHSAGYMRVEEPTPWWQRRWWTR